MLGSPGRAPARTAATLVAGAVAATVLVAGNAATAQAVDGFTVPPAANPDLATSCGLDVVLAIDASYSIEDSGALSATRKAALELVKSFQDKNTDVGIVRFSDKQSTTVAVPLTRATSQTTATGGVHEKAIDHYFSGNATDWQAAAQKIESAFAGSSRPGATKLVIMLTDGAPNEYTDAQGHVITRPAAQFAPSVDAATTVVNQLKAKGVHMLAIGSGKALGTDPATVKYRDALQQVSGPDVYPANAFNASTTDVVLQANLGALQTQFRQLAASALNGPKCSFLAVAPSPSSVQRGAKVAVTGRLTGAGGVVLAGQRVTLQSRAIGASSWSTLGVRTTDARGRVSISMTAKKNRELRGIYYGTGQHIPVVSGTTRVTVAPTVAVSVHKRRVGGHVWLASISGKVTPKKAAKKVQLAIWVKSKHAWVVLAKTKVKSKGMFTFKQRTITKKSKWRVQTTATRDFGAGHSKSFKFKR